MVQSFRNRGAYADKPRRVTPSRTPRAPAAAPLARCGEPRRARRPGDGGEDAAAPGRCPLDAADTRPDGRRHAAPARHRAAVDPRAERSPGHPADRRAPRPAAATTTAVVDESVTVAGLVNSGWLLFKIGALVRGADDSDAARTRAPLKHDALPEPPRHCARLTGVPASRESASGGTVAMPAAGAVGPVGVLEHPRAPSTIMTGMLRTKPGPNGGLGMARILTKPRYAAVRRRSIASASSRAS